MARIEYILDSGERHIVFDSLLNGIDKFMNRDERRKQKDDLIELAFKPAIIIRPIAIFKK